MYTISNIAAICNGQLYGNSNLTVTAFMTDSRQQTFAPGSLFIALITERNNGHRYIPQLKGKIHCFLVSELPQDVNDWPEDAAFVVVPDTLAALQALAAHHRQQFSIPVVGITGSNGKTVVKEWLYQLLQNTFTICRSPKSFNSQLGVPLSVLKLNPSHTLALFEAGISMPGEMAKLQQIIQPDVGVLTSFGDAHNEGFSNAGEKLTEKLLLFHHADKLVMNGVQENNIPSDLAAKTLFVNTSSGNGIEIRFSFSERDTLLHLHYQTHQVDLRIPFTDKASVYNAATCAGVLWQLGLDPKAFRDRFAQLQPVALRLEVKTGIRQSIVINDFYNSDLNSISIALDFLNQQHRRQKRVVILSDVEEHGMEKMALYERIKLLMKQANIDLMIGIGPDIVQHQSLFNESETLFFENTSDFILHFPAHQSLFQNATILLKGARRFGFERISNLLQLKSHDSVLEINLNHLIHNVNYYRKHLSEKTRLMCMVKATAYGSGSSEIATSLQHIGVQYLAVAYADEGVELREANILLPIMVMSPEQDAWPDIVNYHLEPEMYSFSILRQFLNYLEKNYSGDPFPVHIKVDTGMHRLGFEPGEVNELIGLLNGTPLLKVQSVFSHLAASDNVELDAFTNTQIETFKTFAETLESGLGYSVIKHICNSGGISRFPEAHFDMVRLGIGMYGVGVSATEQQFLLNVSRLRTCISQIKHIKAGETVGYNRNGKTSSDITIATIPLGYADGFPRALGNGHHSVFIKGVACKTIGNICMDMCMIDITGVDCHEGDEVVIFETSEQLQLMAQHLNTIAYEVLTSISGRVKRIYIQE